MHGRADLEPVALAQDAEFSAVEEPIRLLRHDDLNGTRRQHA
jgi:hypothetical protein